MILVKLFAHARFRPLLWLLSALRVELPGGALGERVVRGGIADIVEVLARAVIRQHRVRPPLRRGQVTPVRTEEVRGAQGGVVNLLGVGHPIAVRIAAVDRPRAWNELHRPHRAVKLRVAIEGATVRVRDEREVARAVERRANDRWLRNPIAVEATGIKLLARIGAVAGLYPTNSSQRIPLQIAGRPSLRRDQRGVAIGAHRLRVNPNFFRDGGGPGVELVGGSAGRVDVDHWWGGGCRRGYVFRDRLALHELLRAAERAEQEGHERDHHHHRADNDKQRHTPTPARTPAGTTRKRHGRRSYTTPVIPNFHSSHSSNRYGVFRSILKHLYTTESEHSMRLSTRIATVGIAALTGLAGLVAPAAQAQDATSLLQLVNGNVKTMNCSTLRVTLNGTGVAGKDTTRQQLVNNLNGKIGDSIALRVMSGSTVQAVADRALECGIVKPDPVQDWAKLLGSSQTNIPPQLQQLSSNFDLGQFLPR